MRILHTSDWHLDHTLHERRRTEEFSAFLNWLAETLCTENLDVLIVSGDIFNTRTPSVSAQEMYFGFLKHVLEDFNAGKSRCRHVVITAGNHDSPAFLAAPKEVLRLLNVHVITEIGTDELLFLENREKTAAIIVAAVPYLPAKDVILSRDGESLAEKSYRLNQGIQNVYAELLQKAETLRQQHEANYATKIPILATGHLFTQGGKSGLESETGVLNGFRELYVGNLEHFPADGFPDGYSYIALGHLHVPQMVGKKPHIRYSGSPLPINFSEAGQQKEVLVADFNENAITPAISALPVPCFQPLRRVEGDLDKIQTILSEMKLEGSSTWLEVTYTGQEVVTELEERIREFTQDSPMEVLCVRNRVVLKSFASPFHESETLDNLDEITVFSRLMAQKGIPESQQADLLVMFREVLEGCRL